MNGRNGRLGRAHVGGRDVGRIRVACRHDLGLGMNVGRRLAVVDLNLVWGGVVRDGMRVWRSQCGVALVHCSLHLLENTIDLEEVTLGSDVVGAREEVVLGRGPDRGSQTSRGGSGDTGRESGRRGDGGQGGGSGDGGGIVVASNRVAVNWKRVVKRHQRAADLCIRRWVNFAAFHTGEEVVDGLITTLTALERRGGSRSSRGGGVAGEHVSARLGRSSLIIHWCPIRRRLLVRVCVSLPIVMGLTQHLVSPYRASVIIMLVARTSWRQISLKFFSFFFSFFFFGNPSAPTFNAWSSKREKRGG